MNDQNLFLYKLMIISSSLYATMAYEIFDQDIVISESGEACISSRPICLYAVLNQVQWISIEAVYINRLENV